MSCLFGANDPYVHLFSPLSGWICDRFAWTQTFESAKAGSGDSGAGRSHTVFFFLWCRITYRQVNNTNSKSHFCTKVVLIVLFIGPVIGDYLYGKIGFFCLCVVMGCFLFACMLILSFTLVTGANL